MMYVCLYIFYMYIYSIHGNIQFEYQNSYQRDWSLLNLIYPLHGDIFLVAQGKLSRMSLVMFVSYLCSVAQWCLTLCCPIGYNPPSSSVYWIFQARILVWVSISFSKGSSWPKDRTMSLAFPILVGRFFTISTMWEDLKNTTGHVGRPKKKHITENTVITWILKWWSYFWVEPWEPISSMERKQDFRFP